jgi:hypothetical protein
MRSHDSSRMDETDPVGGAEIFQVRRQQCRARQMPKAEFQRGSPAVVVALLIRIRFGGCCEKRVRELLFITKDLLASFHNINPSRHRRRLDAGERFLAATLSSWI